MNHKHLTTDLNTLKLLLAPLISEHLTHKPATQPIKSSTNLRLLNLACGRADESGILRDLLSPLTANLEIIGVDIRARELDIARELWRSDQRASFQFIYHDATKLHLINALFQPVDIVLMRHQNYWNGAMVWQKIYDSALQRLSTNPKGLLIITSYFDQEHLQAVLAIQNLGATLITSIRNPHSRPVPDAPNKSVDRHIAVFKR